MLAAAVAVAIGFGGIAGTQAAGTLGDYHLLFLNGQRVKWGSPVLGAGAVVTYAVATQRLQSDGAFNCPDINPVDGLLATSHISEPIFDVQLDAAFAAWERAANISFVRTDDASSANIVIGAEMTPLGRSFTNVATRAGSAAPTQAQPIGGAAAAPGVITRSLICLNPDQAWKVGFDGNLAVYDLRYTLMHEIGHAIGLDHPDSLKAVMDYHYTEIFSVLQAGDIAGAVALYGTRQPAVTVVAAPANGRAGTVTGATARQ